MISNKMHAKYLEEHNNYQKFYTEAGRVRLAQQMTAPISRAVDYAILGRILLMVDELPQSFYARAEQNAINTMAEIGLDTSLMESNIDIKAEEYELYNYLIWYKDIKEERNNEIIRNNIKNSISQLQLGD